MNGDKKFEREQDPGARLRAKRLAAGIPGAPLCIKLGIDRARLSNFERGYVPVNEDEIARIETALDELIRARSAADEVLHQLGWPTAARRMEAV